MGKLKVIEDSDDEDGADTTSPQSPHGNSQHNTCIEPENEIPMVPDHLDTSAGPSTASTGLAFFFQASMPN